MNWFGSESEARVPRGLNHRSLGELMEFVQANGFNALRVTFSLQNVESNELTPSSAAAHSVELAGTDYVGMLEAIVAMAARRNLLVLLGCHRIKSGYPHEWPGKWNGRWTDGQWTPSRVLAAWSGLMKRVCRGSSRPWNLLGIDVLNEPFGQEWDDWADVVQRVGNHVLELCPSSLVFAQGTGSLPPKEKGVQWGGNMIGAGEFPIALSNESKLVYAPHVYGPSLSTRSHAEEPEYFSDADFPQSMRDIWTHHFGFVRGQTGAPLVIGEAAAALANRGKPWLEELIRWATEEHLGIFYSALSPEAGGVGGVLLDDWTTPDVGKLGLLRALPATNVSALFPAPPRRPRSAGNPLCETEGRKARPPQHGRCRMPRSRGNPPSWPHAGHHSKSVLRDPGAGGLRESHDGRVSQGDARLCLGTSNGRRANPNTLHG